MGALVRSVPCAIFQKSCCGIMPIMLCNATMSVAFISTLDTCGWSARANSKRDIMIVRNYNFCPDTCGFFANFELTFPSMGVCCKLFFFFYPRVFLFADGHWVVWNHLLSDLIVFTLGRLLQTLFHGWKTSPDAGGYGPVRVTMSLSV